MNEQIKQLTRQALDECQAHDAKMIHAAMLDKYGIVEIPQCFSERFAGLIVAECVEQILTGVRTTPPQAEPPELVQTLVRRIEQHFGVAE